MFINKVKELLSRVTLSCLDKSFNIIIQYDKITDDVYMQNSIGIEPRVYIQLKYVCSNTKDNSHEQNWKSGKRYLSQFMTDDEIIKQCYSLFETCIKHEILEGFKVDGKILFNPHVNFEELLKVSEFEITRK